MIDSAMALAPQRPEFAMYKAWLYLSWHGSRQEAIGVLQAAVQRMGVERAFAEGFLYSGAWVSRILGANPWYRSVLQRVALGSPDLDSADYYMHKAALFEAVGQQRTARVYYDSVVPVLEGRLRTGVRAAALADAYLYLGIALGRMGNKKEALAAGAALRRVVLPAHKSGMLGYVYAATGEDSLAVEQFDRALTVPNCLTPRFLALDPGLEALRHDSPVPRDPDIGEVVHCDTQLGTLATCIPTCRS